MRRAGGRPGERNWRASPALLASIALLAAPAVAMAQGEPPPNAGLLLGVRGGYAVPFGDVARDGPGLRDVVDARVPLWLEVGYQFDPHVQAELFLEFAPSFVAAPSCAADVDCSALGISFGLELQLHALPARLVDPWIGVGFGIEVLDATTYFDPGPLGTPGRFERTWRGIELPLVEGGIDFSLSARLRIGPYVAASFARFTSLTLKRVGGTATSGEVEPRANHGWIQAGVKARLAL